MRNRYRAFSIGPVLWFDGSFSNTCIRRNNHLGMSVLVLHVVFPLLSVSVSITVGDTTSIIDLSYLYHPHLTASDDNIFQYKFLTFKERSMLIFWIQFICNGTCDSVLISFADI